MPSADAPDSQPDDQGSHPAIRCDACESALESANRQTVSFLLLDQLTVPLVGCDDHLEQFTSICGLTTEDTASLLSHRPAGGISCPSCRLAPNGTGHAMIPIAGGATVLLACAKHQSQIATRFQTGLETQQQLDSDLDTLS